MSDNTLLNSLLSGKLKLRDLESQTTPAEAALIRKQYLEKRTGLDLTDLEKIGFDPGKLINRNIENLIGSVEIPVGLAGPVTVKGDYADGQYYIPMATTEGALVASTSRGAKVAELSGGIATVLEYIGTTRAPVFKMQGIKDVARLKEWLQKQLPELKKVAGDGEKHLKLMSYDLHSLGKNVWIRFYFDTSEAMGMNMATKATRELADFITANFAGIELVAISGNMCVDKKSSLLNQIKGRGRRVQAEVTVPRKVVEEVLHTTPEKIAEVNFTKIWQGTALAGGISYNAHAANIVAGVFAATGQDLAHIVDSSQCYCVMEVSDGDLYASVSLNSLMLGTVGGGTHLPKQEECRMLMLTDVSGKEKTNGKEINVSHKLAEILGAAVLCGELSLQGAIAAQELVKAHEFLGRGKP